MKANIFLKKNNRLLRTKKFSKLIERFIKLMKISNKVNNRLFPQIHTNKYALLFIVNLISRFRHIKLKYTQ